jgi:RNA polymerase sigma factor (sigma-70 family)
MSAGASAPAADFELLDAWIAGDRAAARALFDRYMAPLYRFFHRKVDGAIEDFVQDTLVACVAARDRFRRESSFRTYLFATARHILWQHLEKQRVRGEPLDPERSSLHELGPSPSTIAAKRAEHRLLLDALRRLPVEQQILLELYHFEEMTAIELAAMYEITEVALRGRLHRAKASLQRECERIADSPALLRSTWDDFEKWAKELRDDEA